MADYQEPVDAWEKVDRLQRQFTKEWEVRRDLRVTALGCKRTVRLGVGTGKPHPKLPGMELLTYNTRNVGTMRELAEAILAACDFVEQSNPEWSARPGPVLADKAS